MQVWRYRPTILISIIQQLNTIKKMKRFLNLPALMLVFVGAMFMTSCEDESGGGTGGGNSTTGEPTLTLNSSSELTLAPTEVFSVDFTAATKNDIPLKAITVYEDGIKVPVSRLTLDGVAFPANPVLLTGTVTSGADFMVGIEAHSTAAQTVQYEVEVLSDDNQTTSLFVNVTTAATPPTFTGAEPMTIEGLEQGSKNGFRLSASPGTGDLVSIEVRENDLLVDPTRIEWDGATMMNAENPFILGDPETSGFEDVLLFITLPMEEGTFVYTITLTDQFSSTSVVTYTVTTAPSGTALETRNDVLLNAAGPDGTGGLDLDEGLGTNSTSTIAEIIDNGADFNQPSELNWIQTISPVNGSTIKYLAKGGVAVSEGFSFDGTMFKEELPDLFDSGEDFTNGMSAKVQVGDVFIVENMGKYWMLNVTEIFIEGGVMENGDFYRFDVRF